MKNTPAFLPSAAGARDDLGDLDDKASILIVDDLPEKLLVFRAVLEELDQHLVFARSGRQALREVLQREFAVILLDVNMPDIDGFDTATLIRQYKRSSHTPIIFITAYADEMQTARGYSLGAVDYILSPVVPHVLRSKVQVFVQQFAMQRQIRRQADAHAAFVAAEAARRVAEENDRRSAFLSNASQALHRSLDVAVAVRELAALLVPRIAALAAVMPLEDDGRAAGTVVVAHSSGPDGAPVLVELAAERLGDDVRRALQTAQRDKVRFDIPLAQFDAASFGPGPDSQALNRPDLPDLPNLPNLRTGTVLPLLSGDRLLGVLLVASDVPAGQAQAPDWCTLDDLAARAAAALENARLFGSLQRQIVERTTIEAALKESNRRKDEFLAMLSHELRNPLAPLRAAFEVMRRSPPSDPKFAWASGVTTRQLDQITRLVDELLDVARISQDKISLKRERIDLNAVVVHCIETTQPYADSRGQAMHVMLPDTPMWLHGDFVRLAQIVSNLLHNACKYSDDGSQILLTATQDEGGAVVRINDQGIGIDSQLLPRIFDLFAQGHRDLDRSQGGLGVGLTLARRLAEMHGGSLEAFSEGAGKGSQFTLRLPCLTLVRSPKAAAAAMPEKASQNENAARRCRVLVVDDNRDAAHSIGIFLALEGHEAYTAGDGREALEIAARLAPDAVVLDIGLPLLDGYQVARALREGPATRGALLIALTGYGQQQDRLAAESAGFDHHFVKPVEPTALVACIEAWARRTPMAATSAQGGSHDS